MMRGKAVAGKAGCDDVEGAVVTVEEGRFGLGTGVEKRRKAYDGSERGSSVLIDRSCRDAGDKVCPCSTAGEMSVGSESLFFDSVASASAGMDASWK